MRKGTSGETRSFYIQGSTPWNTRRERADKANSTGFTIIETIIVLAIAGFIMLIIFYAVPTLRASSNNNAHRNDAARLAAFVNDFIIANSGTLPTQFGSAPGQLDLGDERWAIVDPPQLSSINTFPTPDYGSLSTVIINLGYRCQDNQLNNVGGSEFAIGFKLETLSGERESCLQG